MGKDKEPKKDISRTARCVLDGGDVRLEMGEHTAIKPEPGPTLADIADSAFRACRASLAKLMVPRYRIIVIDGALEEAYGLDRWIKLIDRTHPEYEPKKQRIHAKA